MLYRNNIDIPNPNNVFLQPDCLLRLRPHRLESSRRQPSRLDRPDSLSASRPSADRLSRRRHGSHRRSDSQIRRERKARERSGQRKRQKDRRNHRRRLRESREGVLELRLERIKLFTPSETPDHREQPGLVFLYERHRFSSRDGKTFPDELFAGKKQRQRQDGESRWNVADRVSLSRLVYFWDFDLVLLTRTFTIIHSFMILS